MIRHQSSVLLTLLAFGVAVPAEAHHSGAMFDSGKSVTVTGTVREFQWTNPHCFIQLVETTSSGPAEWSVEMAAPLELARIGWKRTTLSVGDKLTVVMHPMHDGSRGGRFVSATGPKGPLGSHI
jgi:hypothetical protein